MSQAHINTCHCCGEPFVQEPVPVTRYQSKTNPKTKRRKDKNCIDCRPEPNKTLDLWQYFQLRRTSFYPDGFTTE